MTKNTTDYDDIALIMAAVISVIAILGLVLFLKGGLTGNTFVAKQNTLEIKQPAYEGPQKFYCGDNAFALWTKNAVNAVLRLDYTCRISDVNSDVTCCKPHKNNQ